VAPSWMARHRRHSRRPRAGCKTRVLLYDAWSGA
jgi:hypothetical protein